MVLKPDQERVRALLTETISLLCKNGLEYKSDFVIEALIGITIDKDDVFLISIKETIENEAKKALEEAERLEREKAEQLDQENARKSPSRCRRSPKRRRRSRSNASDSDINNEEPSEKRPTVERGDGDSSFNIKQEIEDEEDEDLVFVKSEGDINMKQSHSFADMQSTSYMNDSSQYSDTGGGGAFSDTSFADNSASFGDGWSGAYPPGGAGPPGGPPPGFMPGTDEQSQQRKYPHGPYLFHLVPLSSSNRDSKTLPAEASDSFLTPLKNYLSGKDKLQKHDMRILLDNLFMECTKQTLYPSKDQCLGIIRGLLLHIPALKHGLDDEKATMLWKQRLDNKLKNCRRKMSTTPEVRAKKRNYLQHPNDPSLMNYAPGDPEHTRQHPVPNQNFISGERDRNPVQESSQNISRNVQVARNDETSGGNRSGSLERPPEVKEEMGNTLENCTFEEVNLPSNFMQSATGAEPVSRASPR